MIKTERPATSLTSVLLPDHTNLAWLATLGTIIQDKDKAVNLYRNNPTYVIYHQIARLLKPKSILEVGVRFGYSLASLACGAGLSVNVFGVDQESYEKGSNAIATASLKTLGVEAQITFADSKGFDVAKVTGRSQFDLIHIDGDHTTEGALRDLMFYSKHTKCILLDDLSDARVWRGLQAFIASRENPVSATYLDTATGLALLQL